MRYSGTAAQMGVRASLHALTVVVVVAAALLLGLWLYWSLSSSEAYPVAWFIITAAILGSLVNQPHHQSELQQSTGAGLLGFLAWKAAVAIVFAFLFYLMLIGGLVSGDMFPQFSHTEMSSSGAYVSMEAFMKQVKPESYKDVAKILVWSFIAGYSERLVPNLVSGLIGPSAQERRSGST